MVIEYKKRDHYDPHLSIFTIIFSYLLYTNIYIENKTMRNLCGNNVHRPGGVSEFEAAVVSPIFYVSDMKGYAISPKDGAKRTLEWSARSAGTAVRERPYD